MSIIILCKTAIGEMLKK